MKVILLFALFGLSFCQDIDNTKCPSRAPYADDKDCLTQALKQSAEYVYRLGILFCEYAKLSKSENYENHKAAAIACMQTLECLGCKADDIFGHGKTFEDISIEIAEAANVVTQNVYNFLVEVGLYTPVAKALCTLAGGFLRSDCVKKALGNLAPDVVKNLESLYCEAKQGKADEVAEKLAAILGKFGCGADAQLETGETLENLLQNVGDSLAPLIKHILLVTQKLLGDLICTVLNPPVRDPIKTVLSAVGH